MSSNFDMKDMGEASYVLEIRDRSRRIFGLSQETYIKSILERLRMQSCIPIDSSGTKGESPSL